MFAYRRKGFNLDGGNLLFLHISYTVDKIGLVILEIEVFKITLNKVNKLVCYCIFDRVPGFHFKWTEFNKSPLFLK